MNERVRHVAERIRQKLVAVERVVHRVNRAMAVARRHSEAQDLYLDSAVLCLHDVYTGIDRCRPLPSGHYPLACSCVGHD